MDIRIKNTAGVVLVILMIAGAYAVISYVNSYGNAIINPPAFSVTGEGEVVGVPDIAKFSARVITQGGNDLASIQEQNTEKANAVIDFLKKEGIKEEDIKTNQYSIEPRRSSTVRGFGDPSGDIIGYNITQSVEITIRDFEKIGTLLSGVVDAGANSVSNFRFTFDDPIELQNEARDLAIKQAQRKAELIAEAGGFKLGRLLSIDENFYYPSSAKFGLGGDGAFEVAQNSPVPTIQPGSEEITISVFLRYEINN